ncbi:MAG: hypothetical protein NWE88_09270 [Candidatus Bathyarchaeota archaeon]|nr:hypothetical protein [Candidatus Bathyarchaeota archaeon]
MTGAAGQVTSGSEVKVYWDYATGASAWLLNTTTGDPDGSYEVNIDVPETEVGDHYIWVVDVATGLNNGSLDVNVDPTLEVDVTSGLPGDTVTLTGYGFDAEAGFNVSIFNITAGNMDTSVALVVDNDEETDVYGSFEIEVDIPASVLTYDDYFFNVSSAAAGDSFNVTTAFTIGASITLTEDEGPEGFVIEIVGRGFEADQTLTVGNVTWDGPAGAYGSDGNLTWVDDPDINADGEFTGEIVAPSWGVGDWRVQVTDGTNWAEDNFTIDGTASIEVDPTYGSPGAGITVTGANFTQIAGTEVTITLNTTTETVDTLADGTFTVTITAPATEFKTHDVDAVDEYTVNATDTFKIGLIAMLINPESGPSGTEVSLTGIGFTNGLYNMTFEDDLLLDNQAVTSEQISDDFVVPTVDPGTYTVTVVDEDENTLSRTFTVTATTSLAGTPSDIAVGYNMSIYGEHFTEVAATALTFYAYNATWGMTTAIVVNETFGVASTSSADGNFTGYWVVPDTMLLGNTYTMNVTDANDLYAEFDFTVVEEEVEINPNKASYSLGDTITFTIKATFEKVNSYLEIVDPSEEQIFISTFAGIEWEEISGWQVVRIPNQVQDGSLNPLMIPSDGDTGTWVWTLYDVDDDVIKNGTIEILPTTAAQVDARLSDVEGSIADLAVDIAGVTTDLEDDIDALSSEIGDVASDVDGLKDEIVGDLADDIAAATAAGNAAGDAVADLDDSLSDLEDSMGDIADASNSALDAAQEAADAAADAATAAEGAGDAAKGLTSLVYGAIGASLIAALAAIVSLMQISKKIAG